AAVPVSGQAATDRVRRATGNTIHQTRNRNCRATPAPAPRRHWNRTPYPRADRLERRGRPALRIARSSPPALRGSRNRKTPAAALRDSPAIPAPPLVQKVGTPGTGPPPARVD